MMASAFEKYKTRYSKLPHKYHEIILSLRDELKKSGTISRVEYVGSAFKKTSLDDSDMDNLFVKRDLTISDDESPIYGGYAILFNKDGDRLQPKRIVNKFRGKVQKALNDLGYSSYTTLNEHGPALEMRYRDSNLKFDTDLVFCYEISGEKMYIAKPPLPNWHLYNDENTQFLWKNSTALEEKRYMSIIDRDNQVSRWAVRVVKALIKADPTLRVLTSYIIEQSLYDMRDNYDSSFFRESNLNEIIRALLNHTAWVIENEGLRNKFNTSQKILPDLSPITRSNVVNRLRRLARDPDLQKVVRIISPEKEEEQVPFVTKTKIPFHIVIGQVDELEEEEQEDELEEEEQEEDELEDESGMNRETNSSTLTSMLSSLAIGFAISVAGEIYKKYKK